MTTSKQKQENARDHEFDGIVELDNDLPRWWVLLFIVTIIFAVGYFAWYHLPFLPSLSLSDEYEADVRAASLAAAAATATMDAKSSETAAAFDYDKVRNDAKFIAAGKESYTAYCVACHGVAGQGLVGPNLTDDFWIYGATLAAVEKTVIDGVLEKGMPPWGEVLGVEKVRQVVTFVRSLKHTNPEGAKPPQGDPGELP